LPFRFWLVDFAVGFIAFRLLAFPSLAFGLSVFGLWFLPD
jgi:hypothetical protein